MKKCDSYSDKELLEEYIEVLKGRINSYENDLANAKNELCKSERLLKLTNDQSFKNDVNSNKSRVKVYEEAIVDTQKYLSEISKTFV